MKYLISILTIFLLLTHGVFALSVEQNVTSIQSYNGQAPSGEQSKGFVGQVLSDIFWATGYIKNEFITAFQNIEGNFSNNIPRWDGNKFVEGSMKDAGGKIGIGISDPSAKLHVDGVIRGDGGFQVDGVSMIGGDAWIEGDRIRQNTIDGGEIQNNSLTASDLAANSVGNSELIDTPLVSRLYLGSTDTSLFRDSPNRIATDDSLYIRSGSPSTYLYSVNTYLGATSGDTTHLRGNTFRWDQGVIQGNGRVGIGTTSPTQKLDVNGKIRMRNQTANSDSDDTVVTKGYVDTTISGALNASTGAATFALRKSNGQNGGGYTVGNNKRTLNTVVHNNISGAELNNGTVTLPAGTYLLIYETLTFGEWEKTQAWIKINGVIHNATAQGQNWSYTNRQSNHTVNTTYSSTVPFNVTVGIYAQGAEGDSRATGYHTSISNSKEYYDSISVLKVN